jgi:hypothetical protein
MVVVPWGVTIEFFEGCIVAADRRSRLRETTSGDGIAIAIVPSTPSRGRSPAMKHTIVLIALGVVLTPFTLFVSDCVARNSYGQDVDSVWRDAHPVSGGVFLCQGAGAQADLGCLPTQFRR